jgi:thiamine biosynthesis lipoprotein
MAACFAPAIASGAQYRTGQPVMGTVLQITVIAETEQLARRAAEAGVAEARRWDDILTTWRPEGELARLNAAAGSGDVAISVDLLGALRRMEILAARTGGAFDPAVGASVARWRQPATAIAVGSAISPTAPLTQALRLGSTTARLASGVVLDAGGVGKGMALDAVAKLLRANGVQAAFLDFGGSSQLAIGAPPESPEGWTLAVAGLDAGVVHGTFALRQGSLSTSRATGAGAPEGPIIDPRSRVPVSVRRAVTVWHARASEADAWSTALVVLGRDGIELARKAGGEVLLEDAAGILKTEGFRLVAADRTEGGHRH